MKTEHIKIIKDQINKIYFVELGNTAINERFINKFTQIDNALAGLAKSLNPEDAVDLLRVAYEAHEYAKQRQAYTTLFENIHHYLLLVLTSDFSTYKDRIIEYRDITLLTYKENKITAEAPCPIKNVKEDPFEQEEKIAAWEVDTKHAKKILKDINIKPCTLLPEKISVKSQEYFQETMESFAPKKRKEGVSFFEAPPKKEKYFTDKTTPTIHTEKILLLQKIMIEELQKKNIKKQTIDELNNAFGKIIAAEYQHNAEANEETINAWHELIKVLNGAQLVSFTPAIFEIARNPDLNPRDNAVIEQINTSAKKRKQETVITQPAPSWEEKVLRLIADAGDATTQQTSSSTQASDTQSYAAMFPKQTTPIRHYSNPWRKKK